MCLCIIRKFFSKNLFYTHLKAVAEVFEILFGQVGIALIALFLLEVVHHIVELYADTFTILRLNAFRLLHHHV